MLTPALPISLTELLRRTFQECMDDDVADCSLSACWVRFGAFLSGPAFARYLGEVTRIGAPIAWAWLVLQWPVACALMLWFYLSGLAILAGAHLRRPSTTMEAGLTWKCNQRP